LMDADAMLAGVIEHQMVEFASPDLPGLGAFVRPVVEEIKRLRQLAPVVDELDAVLLDEMAALHLVEHAQPLEQPVSLRDERLADMKPRKALPFKQLDAMPL